MLIENKANGLREHVTTEQWETLKAVGFSASWRIISREDDTIAPIIPKEILDMKGWEEKPKRKTKNKKT